jgi:hypothetical protein
MTRFREYSLAKSARFSAVSSQALEKTPEDVCTR